MKFRFLPHIAVQVRRREEAVAFYRDVIGMDLLDNSGGEARMKLDDAHFYLEESDGGTVFLAFEVDDLVEARAVLEAHGARISDECPEGFMVRDPFGLLYYLSKAQDET